MELYNLEKILDEKLQKNKAEDWDNIGLLIGRKEKNINRVLIALELTEAVLQEAISVKADLVLAHHPLIFSGLKKIVDQKGDNLVYNMIREDIAFYAAHTNFDKLEGGLNDYLAKLLEAKNVQIIPDETMDTGILRVFEVEKKPVTAVIEQIKKVLKIDKVRLIGDLSKEVTRIGVVTGAGGEYAEEANKNQADIFISGDIKYHQAVDFIKNNITVLDVGHFETEKIFPEAISEFLGETLLGLGIDYKNSQKELSPFIFI